MELAIGLMLFLTVVLGVIEFSYALFNWAKMAEATRAGSRRAIVNDPGTDLSTLKSDCSEGTFSTLQTGPSDKVFTTMEAIFSPLEKGQVLVTYRCSGTGYKDRPTPVLTVSVEVQGVEHPLLIPRVLGLDTEWTLPAFVSSRTSEDLETQPPS